MKHSGHNELYVAVEFMYLVINLTRTVPIRVLVVTVLRFKPAIQIDR